MEKTTHLEYGLRFDHSKKAEFPLELVLMRDGKILGMETAFSSKEDAEYNLAGHLFQKLRKGVYLSDDSDKHGRFIKIRTLPDIDSSKKDVDWDTEYNKDIEEGLECEGII